MQTRIPKDEIANEREDSSQIKSYFRNTTTSRTTSSDSDFFMELVEREIDLRARGTNEYKCTLIFNNILKIGDGVRDRLKRTAKIRAHEHFKAITRNTPRENLMLKATEVNINCKAGDKSLRHLLLLSFLVNKER